MSDKPDFQQTLLYISGGALALYLLPRVVDSVMGDLSEMVLSNVQNKLSGLRQEDMPLTSIPNPRESQLFIVDHPEIFGENVVRAARESLADEGIIDNEG